MCAAGNIRMRGGKSSELRVVSELVRLGVDVFLPCVDDKAIDFVIRQAIGEDIQYFDIQVKSVKGYNRIIGLGDINAKADNYILVIHYRHASKPDEFFYLLGHQILEHWLADSGWGDLVFNKPQRQQYASQDLPALARYAQGL